MKNKMKEMMDEEQGYFFGFPKGRYTEVRAELARTKVNSSCTSSIPLAEFWQPANLAAIKSLLEKAIPEFCPESNLKYFEFPTEAMWNGKRIGNPSMTDIMILDSDLQVAIEGKMTGKFVEGCLANPEFRTGKWQDEGEARSTIARIWKGWESFAAYAFNKSHAVAYAWLAYQSAYLKAHYPVEFSEAVCGGKAIEDMV